MSRSVKKGPYVDRNLYRKVLEMSSREDKRSIKTYGRSSTIIPEMIGLTLLVHNGKTFIPIYITEDLVGHKLGEFSPTRIFRGHAGSDKKGKR